MGDPVWSLTHDGITANLRFFSKAVFQKQTQHWGEHRIVILPMGKSRYCFDDFYAFKLLAKARIHRVPSNTYFCDL